MRVTRETLIRLAKERIQEHLFNNDDLLAAYLTGSLLMDDPFLGGVTDIDMVYVTRDNPPRTREIVPLTPDFHFDILYRAKGDYTPPREVRVDPFLGYEIYDPMPLHEDQHFLEFTQATVRAGFEFQEPEIMLQRCRKLLADSRSIWFDLMDVRESLNPVQVRQYLDAVYLAANAVAELSGPPLSERRLLMDFPERAEQAERPGFRAGLIGLLGGTNLPPTTLETWLPKWKSTFTAAAETGKAHLNVHTARVNYYLNAFEAMLGSQDPIVILWPTLRTWTYAALALAGPQTADWGQACKQLGLLGTAFHEKVQGLDHFIDEIEIRLDEIAEEYGLETSTSI
jgi:predicted nucleotidyltransferase